MRIRPSTMPAALSLLAIPACLAMVHGVGADEIDEAKALKVKAAYLYNFAKFIEWPGDALGDESSPFVIGVLGDDALATQLAATVADKSIVGRPVTIRRMENDPDDQCDGPAQCHVFYVGRSAEDRLPGMLRTLARRPVLLVSDIPGFARKGGMIGFVIEEGRIIFEINRVAIERATLKASAKMLSLARIVESGVTATDKTKRKGDDR